MFPLSAASSIVVRKSCLMNDAVKVLLMSIEGYLIEVIKFVGYLVKILDKSQPAIILSKL